MIVAQGVFLGSKTFVKQLSGVQANSAWPQQSPGYVSGYDFS
jgi:hypothetical protein